MKNILMMVGMCLTILFGYNMTNPVTEANTHAIREVKVQAGDTMWDIAKKFYTTTEEIIRLNHLESEELHPFDTLILVKSVESK